MSEEVQEISQVQNQEVSPVAETVPASSEAAPPVPERTFKQEDVDKIAARSRSEGRESGYERARRELQEQAAHQSQPTQQAPQGNEDLMRQMVSQEIHRMAQKATAEQVTKSFLDKVNSAKDRYPDIENIVSSDLNLKGLADERPAVAAALVTAMNSHENVGDVFMEFSKNPTKYGQVLYLLETAPELGRREISKLAESLKRNQEAAKQPSVSEPLSQLKPSTLSTSDGTKMTVSDLRRNPLFRV